MKFEFATANRIIFGSGTVREIPSLLKNFNRERILLVTGKNNDRSVNLIDNIQAVEYPDMGVYTFNVSGEPSIDTIVEGIHIAKENNCSLVIGFGGGSAIDTGKAISALVTQKDGEITDYLEVIGNGKPLKELPLPFIAVPTTAGTGSEVTKNAVISIPSHRVKVSLRSNSMLPSAAVVDPELTLSLSPEITASTGLDALTQLIEPYVCNSPNPFTDAICMEGIKRAARSLKIAFKEGQNISAREDMSVASLFGGIALANAKLGAVHGFAGPMGGMFHASHGRICARLLPFVMEANIKAMKSREPSSPAIYRYSEVAKLITGNPSATVEDGIEWVYNLCNELNILPLSSFGIKKEDLPGIVSQAQKASSMKGNPILLNEDELFNIMERAL